VGPSGHVLATDIDVRWVQDPTAAIPSIFTFPVHFSI
jgi:hypothetical protein